MTRSELTTQKEGNIFKRNNSSKFHYYFLYLINSVLMFFHVILSMYADYEVIWQTFVTQPMLHIYYFTFYRFIAYFILIKWFCNCVVWVLKIVLWKGHKKKLSHWIVHVLKYVYFVTLSIKSIIIDKYPKNAYRKIMEWLHKT